MAIQEKITNNLKQFGRYLECQTCGRKEQLGSISNSLSNGWKKCCGYTMRWIAQNKINKGL